MNTVSTDGTRAHLADLARLHDPTAAVDGILDIIEAIVIEEEHRNNYSESLCWANDTDESLAGLLVTARAALADRIGTHTGPGTGAFIDTVRANARDYLDAAIVDVENAAAALGAAGNDRARALATVEQQRARAYVHAIIRYPAAAPAQTILDAVEDATRAAAIAVETHAPDLLDTVARAAARLDSARALLPGSGNAITHRLSVWSWAFARVLTYSEQRCDLTVMAACATELDGARVVFLEQYARHHEGRVSNLTLTYDPVPTAPVPDVPGVGGYRQQD